jgi:hypothetical protein
VRSKILRYTGRIGIAVALLAAIACSPATTQARADPVLRPSSAHLSAPWLATVYYTAVESFHDEDPVQVMGCPVLDCAHGKTPLGSYPADFVAAVREEGTGRITTGPRRGRYLNWSHNVGYWLDDGPRDAAGNLLVPFVSAAADGVRPGTRVELVDCGTLVTGAPVPDHLCRRLRQGSWQIRDEFTPGYGGTNHIDLYIGEEHALNFTETELYVSLVGTTLSLSE